MQQQHALRAIVYRSTATALMPETALESLLIEARRANIERGVTGVLLYSGGSFIQYVEGPEPEVQRAYERIRVSRRHRDLTEVYNAPVFSRGFPGWQMGFANPPTGVLLALSCASWQRPTAAAFDADSPDVPGMALLKLFWHSAPRGVLN